jgi:hypothetical protein
MSISHHFEVPGPAHFAGPASLHPGQPTDMPTALFVAWMQILTDEDLRTNEQVLTALWASSAPQTDLRGSRHTESAGVDWRA